MLIADTHRFVFVHIPKTAGSTGRDALRPYDTRPGAFVGVRDHPGCGRLDFGHIPLAVLAEHFPSELETLRSYFSFAMVRDPMGRFPSSLTEYLLSNRIARRGDLLTMGPDEILRCAFEVVEALRQQGTGLLPVELIHLQRQSSYVELDGVRVLDAIIPTEDVSRALPALVLHQFGLHVHVRTRKERRSFKGPIEAFIGRILARAASAEGRGLLPAVVRGIRRRLTVPRNPFAETVLANPELRSFVETYYAEDFVIHERARQAWARGEFG